MLPNDRPTPSGYSGFWQLYGDMLPYTPLTLAQGGVYGANHRFVSKIMRTAGMRALRTAAIALNGAAVGGAASLSYKRVGNPAGPAAASPVATELTDLGGERVIDTVSVINRNTVASDETFIDKLYNGTFGYFSSYPVDAAGNGGGGRAGF